MSISNYYINGLKLFKNALKKQGHLRRSIDIEYRIKVALKLQSSLEENTEILSTNCNKDNFMIVSASSPKRSSESNRQYHYSLESDLATHGLSFRTIQGRKEGSVDSFILVKITCNTDFLSVCNLIFYKYISFKRYFIS